MEEKEKVSTILQKAIKDVMIRIMLVDDIIRSSEKEKIREIYKYVTRNEYYREELEQDIECIKSEGYLIGEYIRRVKNLLNDEGKKILLSAAVYISAADSKIKQSEKKMLISLAHKLSLSTDEINKTIESIRRNMSLEEEADESENNENIDSEWMCSWCGKINEAGTRFCSRCNEPNRLLKQTGQ